LEGKIPLPLLGPKAGGTDFRLGPVFYYFQIASAKIFGSLPDKMAYPDLLFSILAIPLLYLLLNKYFGRYISATLAALLSVSMFSVQYSRFAWNPNSSPFFVFLFLYSLLGVSEKEGKHKMFWAVLAGISLGIGVQLHTLLLISMPATAIIFLAYLYRIKTTAVKEFAVIFLFALFLNIPQIFGEFQSEGRNVRAFFSGTLKKTSNEIGVGAKITENFLCQAQGNSYIVSGVGPSGDCGKTVISGELKRHKHFENKLPIILETIFGVIFTIGGLFLWAKAARKESNSEKKKFLILLGIYFLAVFFLLIPLANEISIRFYLALEFIPFLLLGFWVDATLNFTKEKYGKKTIVALFLFFFLLAGNNIYGTIKMFAAFSSQENTSNDNIDNDSESFITLSETEFIANCIIYHAGNQKDVYLEGKEQFLFKYIRSIEYFTKIKGIDVKEYSEKENLPEGAIIMFLGDAKNKGRVDKSLQEKYFASDIQFFGRFSIARLESKL